MIRELRTWLSNTSLHCGSVAEPAADGLALPALGAGIVLTLIFPTLLRRRNGFWETHRAAAVLLGKVSLLMWVGIG